MCDHKPLKFIHIAKNGGTSIEHCAKENKILWGRFDPLILKNNYKYPGCKEHNSLKYATDKSFIKDYDWFIICRNPYDRIVSLVNHYGVYNYQFKKTDNPQTINLKIKQMLKQKNSPHMPQIEYIFDSDGTQIIKHILRFETLKDDFEKLMHEYSLDIKLDKHIDHNVPKIFKRDDLEIETIKAINEVYKEDFEYLKYEMIL